MSKGVKRFHPQQQMFSSNTAFALSKKERKKAKEFLNSWHKAIQFV